MINDTDLKALSLFMGNGMSNAINKMATGKAKASADKAEIYRNLADKVMADDKLTVDEKIEKIVHIYENVN